MSKNETAKWIRRIKKNWLILLSIILLITSAFYIIKSEERRNSHNTKATDANATR